MKAQFGGVESRVGRLQPHCTMDGGDRTQPSLKRAAVPNNGSPSKTHADAYLFFF